jgi:hypothetical protein
MNLAQCGLDPQLGHCHPQSAVGPRWASAEKVKKLIILICRQNKIIETIQTISHCSYTASRDNQWLQLLALLQDSEVDVLLHLISTVPPMAQLAHDVREYGGWTSCKEQLCALTKKKN